MRINATALAYATIGVIWLVVAMTIAIEQQESFKSLLTAFAGHHWVGKSIISALAFILLYLLMRRSRESKNILTLMLVVCTSVIAGGLIVFGFFISIQYTI